MPGKKNRCRLTCTGHRAARARAGDDGYFVFQSVSGSHSPFLIHIRPTGHSDG